MRNLYTILFLGLLIRLGFFFSIQPWKAEVVRNDIIISDAIGYDEMATAIVHDLSFKGMSPYRTPGYPLFLAGLYILSSHSIWFVLLVQNLLSVLSIYITYLLGMRMFNEKIGLFAAFLVAIDFQQALFANTLLTEALFIFLFLWSFYLLIIGLDKKKRSYFVYCGLVMGLATLVRPITFFLPYLLGLAIIVCWKINWKEKMYHVVLMSAVFLLIISTWMAYNYHRYNQWQLTTLTEYNILYWNAAYTEVYKTGLPIDSVRASFDSLALKAGADLSDPYSFSNANKFYQLGKEYLDKNKAWYIKRHAMGIINLYAGMGIQHVAAALHIPYNAYSTQPFANPNIFTTAIRFFQVKSTGEILLSIFLIAFMLFNYVFALIGLVSSWRHYTLIVILVVIIILYFSILTGVIGWVRYRLPFMPLISILGAFGFYNRHYRYKSRLHSIPKGFISRFNSDSI